MLNKSKRLLCLSLIGLFVINHSYGQQKLEINKYIDRSTVVASPTATAFQTFGQVPVSHFTGTPDISIPLHKVEFKELAIDLDLRYHQTLGVKPDAFPGSTGNGWLLNTGGAITRISRGVTPANFGGLPVPALFNPTENEEWSSDSTMQEHIKRQTVFVNADGRYDEYTYSFGGYSGKFYMDHTDTFRIKTAQGEDLLVEKEPSISLQEFTMPLEEQGPASCLGVMEPYTNIIKQRYITYKFTVTDSHGVKYTFGGTNESIEFTRPGMIFNIFDLDNSNTVPTNWYLTSIESPNGYKISLYYKRDKFYITNEIAVHDRYVYPSNQWGNFDNFPKGKVIKSTLYHPCYLDRIVTPTSTINFNWSKASGQLGYQFTIYNPPLPDCGDEFLYPDPYNEIHFTKYPEIKDASMVDRFPNKLDSITVYTSAGSNRKVVKFSYTNSTATRLKLLSVKIKGGTQELPPYTFEYNDAVPLPEYLSFKTDDYGFYNNRNLYITSDSPPDYDDLFADSVARKNYIDSRRPDINYSQAEILKKITYPTGGYIEYEFENNKYGRVAKFWPATIQENTDGSKYTGGLRIKRITSYDYLNHKATEKKYFYNLNYSEGDTTSSGVLSFQPIHYTYFNGPVTSPARYAGTSSAGNYTGTMTYIRQSTDPINTNPNGNHITYSEVTELNLDGSYTVFKYKNYDNGYHDLPAENMVCDNSNVGPFWENDEMNSLEIERGQILNENQYSSTGDLKQRITYAYNDSLTRFQENVRRIKLIPNPIFTRNYPSLRYTASLIYTYFPYLKSRIVTNYEQGGELVNSITSYFNKKRLLLSESTVDSKGRDNKVFFKYPADFLSDTVPAHMVSRHIIAPVIEKAVQVDGVQTNLVQTKYFAPYSHLSIYVPREVNVKIGTNPIENRQKFNLYDGWGNLLEQQKSDGIKEAYLWGYGLQYQVASVIGSDYPTASSFIDPDVLETAFEGTESYIRLELNKIRTGLAGTGAQVTTYTYSPLVGVNSVTDPNGKTIHYQYDNFNRLKSLHNTSTSGPLRASYCYNYAGQVVDCAALAPTGSIAASTLALIAQSEPALPVTLVEFKVSKIENAALLKWSTHSEINSERFNIERSKDGKSWKELGSVVAVNSGNDIVSYSFEDRTPEKGENLYRLKMVDKDGSFAYSTIRSLVFDKAGEVSIYPNPVSVGGSINLQIDDLSKIKNIKIFDSSGQLVAEPKVSKEINLAKVQPGLYVVQLLYIDGSVSTHRIVKQ